MLTKSIIASLLVLGTSSVALAAPCETPAPVAAQPVYTQPAYTSPVNNRPVYQQAGQSHAAARRCRSRRLCRPASPSDDQDRPS